MSLLTSLSIALQCKYCTTTCATSTYNFPLTWCLCSEDGMGLAKITGESRVSRRKRTNPIRGERERHAQTKGLLADRVADRGSDYSDHRRDRDPELAPFPHRR